MFQKHKAFFALRAAAAELDHLAAAGGPLGDAAVEHRAGVDAFAARIEAAMPARAPLSQIVTTGRSAGTSAPQIGRRR